MDLLRVVRAVVDNPLVCQVGVRKLGLAESDAEQLRQCLPFLMGPVYAAMPLFDLCVSRGRWSLTTATKPLFFHETLKY